MEEIKCFLGAGNIVIPQELQKIVIDTMCKLSLKKDDLRELGEDVYLTKGIIPPHIDDTFDGLVTVVCVLHSVGDYWFGCSDEGLPNEYKRRTFLPTGRIFKFDARYMHELNKEKLVISNFAAIIWDIPRSKTIAQIKVELQERIDYLAANGLPQARVKLTDDLI